MWICWAINGRAIISKNEVTIYDINKNKINCINNKKSPIQDSLISEYLKNHDLNIHASDSKDDALRNNDIIILAILQILMKSIHL